MNFQAFSMEQATLTLTQMHLGSELVWEPKVGTVEHDRFVDAYIPGPHTLQTKRATMSLDFFSTVEATTMPFPFTRTYHALVPVQTSPISLKSFDSFSSVASSPAPSQKAAGTKRSYDGASAPSKRLPGFSIMTRDGVDITENQSRGPKTKEQREHAAKMRKLGACPSCKRRKQKCEPSHHRPSGALGASGSAAATPMSSSMSARSSIPSLTGPSPSLGSRASISPQSSLESAFTPSPNLMMPVGVPKQHQQWEDGLISADLLDDDFMIQNPQFDNFTFGRDMFSQNAAAGNWDFAVPPMGQDFDLFSYDNTLDFDANLYVNTPSPLLQSSGLSPTSLQQPPQAFQQQSMDSQSPFAYDVNGQYLGNMDGAAGQYGVENEFGDTGEYGGLAPDRNGDARATPQEGPKMVKFVKTSSCLTKEKQNYSIQTTEVSSLHSTDSEFASIAESPQSPLQASLQSSSHHSVMNGCAHGHEHDDALRHQVSRQPSVEPSSPWSSFLDYSGGEVLRRTWATGHQNSLQSGSTNDLHDQQLQTTVNHTDGVHATVQQSPYVHDRSRDPSSPLAVHKVADSSGSVQPPQAGVPPPTLLGTAPTWSPSSAVQDTAPTWDFQPVAGASTATQVTLRKAFKAHKSSRPTLQSSVGLPAPTECGICPTTTTPGSTSSEVVATNSPRISVAVHTEVAKASRIRTVVNGGVVKKVERETLNEHTAQKTHSLSTSKFVASETQSVLSTVRKLATTYGFVVSTDAKKPGSMFSGFTQTVSSLVNAFRIGFNLGARQETAEAKNMGRGPGRDLEVAMSGLRLC